MFLEGGPEVSLVFRACFEDLGALLDRGLGPPGANLPALVFACVLRVFCESERELERKL